MRLSIVIPVFNEASTVASLVEAVRAVPLDAPEIIVVDDGSTDGTVEILKSEIEPLVDRVIYHEKNQGKGAALRSGFRAVTGDVVVIQDADLEYDPMQLPTLLAPIESGDADVVFGSRFLGGKPHRVLYFWHMVGNRLLTLFSNMFTNLNLTDMETCYKMMRREVLDSLVLTENRFGIEPEMTAKIAKGDWKVYEVGISYRGRTYEEGKKIGWKDGVRAGYAIVKHNVLRPSPQSASVSIPRRAMAIVGLIAALVAGGAVTAVSRSDARVAMGLQDFKRFVYEDQLACIRTQVLSRTSPDDTLIVDPPEGEMAVYWGTRLSELASPERLITSDPELANRIVTLKPGDGDSSCGGYVVTIKETSG